MSFKELGDFYETLSSKGRPQSDVPPKPLILIIDDDGQLRQALGMALAPRYRIQLCSTPRQGVAAVRDEVSVVILDVRMPEQDGFATYEEIVARDADLPIIFYSAYQDLKDPYEILNRYRPFGYITKGDNHNELLKSVAAAVDQRVRNTRYRTLLKELGDVRSQMSALRQRLTGK